MLNKVQIIGRVGQDPETRYAPSGDAIVNLSIATTETWKDKTSGERREATEWHRTVLFGRLAEIAAQYLRKGSLVYVEGRLQTRKWQDKDGQERYTTEVRVDEMKMFPSTSSASGESQPRRQESPQRQPQRQSQPAPTGENPDIPF